MNIFEYENKQNTVFDQRHFEQIINKHHYGGTVLIFLKIKWIKFVTQKEKKPSNR